MVKITQIYSDTFSINELTDLFNTKKPNDISILLFIYLPKYLIENEPG